VNQRIQALRGISIALVLSVHGVFPNLVLQKVLPGWQDPGWTGVMLFFIISGYVITGSLKRDHCRRARFFVKRFFRLYPVLIAYVAICGSLNELLGHEAGMPLGYVPTTEMLLQSVYVLTGVQKIVLETDTTVPFLYSQIWSLSVEDLFYVVYGLSAAMIFRFADAKRVGLACLTLVVVIVLSRLVLTNPYWIVRLPDTGGSGIWETLNQMPNIIVMVLVDSRAEFILCGIAIATLGPKLRLVLPNWGDVVLIALPLIPVAACGTPLPPADNSFRLTLFGDIPMYLCFGLAVAHAAKSDSPLGLVGRLLARLGDISYSTYLVHIPVSALFSVLLWRIDPAWSFRAPLTFYALLFVGYIPVSIALASLCYRYLERPAIDAGRRLLDRRPSQLLRPQFLPLHRNRHVSDPVAPMRQPLMTPVKEQ
jgi:peptidoglycan/LPS O-acetylase OafA/YrhL